MIRYPGHAPIPILYEDNHLIAVDKPAGLLSQKDHSMDADILTLTKAYLAEKYDKKGNVYLGLVHRLDRPVSGVMLMARTSKAASRLSEQIRSHQWKKMYLAICEGVIDQQANLKHYLLKHASTNQSKVVSASTKGAKQAELGYKRLSTDGKRSLVKVELKTGRAHQIRVQFAHIGHPLLNDAKYGGKAKQLKGDIALRAHALTVIHPTKKEPLCIEASIPSNSLWSTL